MKKQVIEQLQNTLEWVMQEWINTKQELAEVRIELEWNKTRSKIQFEEISTVTIELEETQEALRRNRNQLESYKMFEKELVSLKLEYDQLVFLNNANDKVASMYENMSVWKFIIKKFK